MAVSSKPTSWVHGISGGLEPHPPISGYCDTHLSSLSNPHRDDQRHRQARWQCSHCKAKLCDVHAELCAICLSFFCEGCLDLRNQEGQHAEGNLGELVARVVEEVAG